MKSRVFICVGTFVLVVILWIRFLHFQEAKIKAARDIQVQLIEQEAKTERTEERSQFWQKLVPWGRDEEEQSE